MNRTLLPAAPLTLVLMFLVGNLALSSEPPRAQYHPADANTQSAQYRSTLLDQLIVRAEPGSRVSIIVGLDRSFDSLGRLSPTEQNRARDRISEAQSTFAARLPRGKFAEKRRYKNIPFMAIEIDAAQLALLKSMPEIASIEEDSLARTTLLSSNTVIGSPTAWGRGYDGATQAIAILDTGVDTSHPYFDNNSKVIAEACFSSSFAPFGISSACPGGVSFSTAEGSGGPCSTADCDHGTHVAGIAVGNDQTGPDFGVARGANLIAIQVFSNIVNADPQFCGSAIPCSQAFSSDFVAALDYLYEISDSFDIAAVNMSFGSGGYSSDCDLDAPSMKEAIDNLRSVGIAAVVASGNDGFRNAVGAPACISGAISVSATQDNDSIPDFSNVADFISLLAPGYNITSAIPGGGTASWPGTSMAAPHVAGAWAVLRQAKPDASIDEILQALTTTGTVVDDNRDGSEVTGMRRINVDLALNELVPEIVVEGLSGSYVPISGCRVVDSRAAQFSLSPIVETSFLAGRTGQTLGSQGGEAGGCDIPNNASALQVNFTVITQGTRGHLRAWPEPELEPTATVLAWSGSSVSNAFSLPICTNGPCSADFVVKPYGNWTNIDLVVDIFGYYLQ